MPLRPCSPQLSTLSLALAVYIPGALVALGRAADHEMLGSGRAPALSDALPRVMPKAKKPLPACEEEGRGEGVHYYGMKSEPSDYAWADLVKEGSTEWDGVRNYQARNIMKEMAVGDVVFFYHSVSEKQFVGVAKVVKTAYQDPTTSDSKWVAVDIAPVKKLAHPVTLASVKKNEALADMALVKQGRLSVFPLTKRHVDTLLGMAGTKL